MSQPRLPSALVKASGAESCVTAYAGLVAAGGAGVVLTGVGDGAAAVVEWLQQPLTSTSPRTRERRPPPTVGHLESVDVERFVVVGGARLSGQVAVSGAKNSVLKLMAAT